MLFLSVALHAYFHLGVFRSFEASHGFLVSYDLAYERLSVYAHNLVAGKDACLFSRAVLYYALHVYGVVSYDKLNAHARERAFQVVGGLLYVLRADVDRVGVEVRQNLRYGLVDERVDVNRVNILVVYDVQQIVQAVAARVYYVQAVA